MTASLSVLVCHYAPGYPPQRDVEVRVTRSGALLATGRTGTDGVAHLAVPDGVPLSVSLVLPAGHAVRAEDVAWRPDGRAAWDVRLGRGQSLRLTQAQLVAASAPKTPAKATATSMMTWL